MKKIFSILTILFLLIGITTSFSAIKHIRQGAGGANTGDNWNDAYSSFPSVLSRDNIYYVADGTYGGQDLNDPEDGTKIIIIRKATASAHGSDTGWNSTYGDGQAIFGTLLFFNSYYTIDGVSRNESNWQDGASYGFRINACRANSANLEFGDNIVIQYSDIGGTYQEIYTTGMAEAIYITYNNHSWTVRKNYIHNCAYTAFQLVGGYGHIIEYNYIGPSWGKEAIRGSSGSDNMIIRYNIFRDSIQFDPNVVGAGMTAEIGIWDGGIDFDNIQIYGNIFTNKLIGVRNGIILMGPWDTKAGNAVNTKIYNNSIIGVLDSSSYSTITAIGTGNDVKNNLYFNTPDFDVNANTVANNTKITAPIVNGFVLTGPAAGTTLASPYNTDFAGMTRGADGVFDIGAYEFDASVYKYVRQGATGNGSGSDWNNAYTDIPINMVRGTTYLIADGTYTGHDFNDALSGTTTITIKKATISAHGVNTGWLDTYGDGQAVFGRFYFYKSYYVINGATRNESNWQDGGSYGFRLDGVEANDANSQIGNHISVSYCNMGGDYSESFVSGLGVAIYAAYNITNWTISRCYVHNCLGTSIQFAGGGNHIVEYSYFGPAFGKEAIRGQNSCYNTKIRYNVFRDTCQAVLGEGITAEIGIWDGTDFDNNEIYGNVFTNKYSGGRNCVILVGGAEGEDLGANNTKVYNNTFIGIAEGSVYNVIEVNGANTEARNNLAYNTPEFNNNADTSSNNLLITSNVFSGFAINTALPGTSLASPYNSDLTGATRGSDGVFDIGAYEFDNGNPPITDVTAPTITSFTIPTTSTTLAVSISTFTATDNIGVTGYLVKESATTPLAGDVGWSGTAPTTFTFTTEGSKTLYAWAKDAAGNISSQSSDTITVTLPVVPPAPENLTIMNFILVNTTTLIVDGSGLPITPTGPVTIGPISIASNDDDGQINQNDNTLYNAGESVEVGVGYAGYYEGFQLLYFRFVLPAAIPAGATIDSAMLELYGVDNFMWINGEDDLYVSATSSADAAAPTTGFIRPSFAGGSLDTTSPITQWPNVTWPNGGYISVDISAIIQQLSDNYGGLSTGAGIVFWVNNTSGFQRFVGAELYERASGNVAKLNVTYSQ